jgi:hypothetical protein
LICQAIASQFAATPPATGCPGRIVNDKKTVTYIVTVLDSAGVTYELEVLGKSVELALGNTNWVERHRFYIAFGFDGQLEPHITVFDFEPMFRSTSDIFPIRDDLFDYIPRQHDSLLRAFQERIKSSISTTIEEAYGVQQAESK